MHNEEIYRITATAIPWPDPPTLANRSGKRLQWRCTDLEGRELHPASARPFEDACAVLLLDRALDGAMKVTMRHSDKPYDSFKPMRLDDAARPSARRRERIAAMKATA